MENIILIFEKILPALITGVFGFLVAKYTYDKNRPLDKLEIAYNRIYYPIYNLIRDENNIDNINIIIEKSDYYFKKYNKYADRSTLKAFNYLTHSINSSTKKAAYKNFINNIYNKNSYLRIRLGYLEPSFLHMYSFSSESEKSTFRIFIEFYGIYFCIIFYNIFKGKIQTIFLHTISFLSIIIIFEILLKFIRFLYFKIKK